MIKPVEANQHLVPVEGSTDGLSAEALRIHKWAVANYQREKKPIRVGDIIRMFGVQHKSLRGALVLKGMYLEELIDASLMYVTEEQPS